MGAETSKKIRANSIFRGLVCCILSAIGFWVPDPKKGEIPLVYHYLFFILFISLLLYTIYLCINRIYLFEDGVRRYCFSRMKYEILWSEVSEVCIVGNFRFSSKTSSDTQIVIVPKECEVYDSIKWSGLQYKFLFRNQIICIDDSPRNRKFLEQHYGEIINKRHGSLNS